MTIYLAIKLYFDQVVQNIKHPVTVTVRLLSLLFCFLISGCNNWPKPAKTSLSITDKYYDVPEAVSRQYIENLLRIAYLRTDILTSKGAEFCIPGQVKKVNDYLKRSRLEVDANLLVDAQYHIALAMKQLEHSVEVMYSLDVSSECLSSYAQNPDKDQDDPHFTVQLSDLLNCNCDQVSSAGVITRDFMKRLTLVSDVMNKHLELSLNIYAIDDASRAIKEVLDYEGDNRSRLFFYSSDKSLADVVNFSDDGLFFNFFLNKNDKIFNLRKWRNSINIKSVINNRRANVE